MRLVTFKYEDTIMAINPLLITEIYEERPSITKIWFNGPRANQLSIEINEDFNTTVRKINEAMEGE